MANIKVVYGTPEELSISNLDSLPANNMSQPSNTIDCADNGYIDLLLEPTIVFGSSNPSGQRQAVVYVATSFDGVNWSTEQASMEAFESNLRLAHVIITTSANQTIRAASVSIATLFGGILPPYIRFYVKNDAGVTFGVGSVLRVIPVTATVE